VDLLQLLWQVLIDMLQPVLVTYILENSLQVFYVPLEVTVDLIGVLQTIPLGRSLCRRGLFKIWGGQVQFFVYRAESLCVFFEEELLDELFVFAQCGFAAAVRYFFHLFSVRVDYGVVFMRLSDFFDSVEKVD
jgi:hypothetical protein